MHIPTWFFCFLNYSNLPYMHDWVSILNMNMVLWCYYMSTLESQACLVHLLKGPEAVLHRQWVKVKLGPPALSCCLCPLASMFSHLLWANNMVSPLPTEAEQPLGAFKLFNIPIPEKMMTFKLCFCKILNRTSIIKNVKPCVPRPQATRKGWEELVWLSQIIYTVYLYSTCLWVLHMSWQQIYAWGVCPTLSRPHYIPLPSTPGPKTPGAEAAERLEEQQNREGSQKERERWREEPDSQELGQAEMVPMGLSVSSCCCFSSAAVQQWPVWTQTECDFKMNVEGKQNVILRWM